MPSMYRVISKHLCIYDNFREPAKMPVIEFTSCWFTFRDFDFLTDFVEYTQLWTNLFTTEFVLCDGL